MESNRTGSRASTAAPIALFVVASAGVLALFTSWNKPLLYDEYVYFALGGLPSTGDVLDAVRETTTNLNQGVTGAFMVSDFWLLKLFGADAGALRLPGLLTAILLFVYSAIFLVGRRVSLWALPAIPAVFVTQELVLRYVGEARTYMPLTAAVIGVLAYYSLPLQSRRTWWGRSTGWSAVLLGALFHPYFIGYWFAIACFGLLVWKRKGGDWSPRAYLNVPLVVVGGAIFAAVGALTWMRGKATADVDPFNFLPGPLPIEVIAQNTYFLIGSPVAVCAALIVAGTPLLLLVRQRIPMRTVIKVSSPPVLLIVLAFGLALAISVSTIVNDFWIFPRQWIASTALAALGGLWLVAEWWKASARPGSSRSASPGRTVASAMSGLAVLTMALPSVVAQWEQLQEWGARPLATVSTQEELRARLDAGEVLSDPEWISYAQVNIDLGGDVWPEFGRYYSEIDWTTFVLTDGSSTQEPGRAAPTQ